MVGCDVTKVELVAVVEDGGRKFYLMQYYLLYDQVFITKFLILFLFTLHALFMVYLAREFSLSVANLRVVC